MDSNDNVVEFVLHKSRTKLQSWKRLCAANNVAWIANAVSGLKSQLRRTVDDIFRHIEQSCRPVDEAKPLALTALGAVHHGWSAVEESSHELEPIPRSTRKNGCVVSQRGSQLPVEKVKDAMS